MQSSYLGEVANPIIGRQQSCFCGIPKGISVYAHSIFPLQGAAGVRTPYSKQLKRRNYKAQFLTLGEKYASTFSEHISMGLSAVSKTHPYKVVYGCSPASIAWRSIESEIEQFSTRPVDWNSYGAQPISQPCKIVALEVVSLLEEGNSMASDVNMTADSDVVISCRIGAYKMKWQFDADGDIAVMVQRQFGVPSFHDLPFDELRAFIQKLNDGGV
jgi:hypothetical protein